MEALIRDDIGYNTKNENRDIEVETESNEYDYPKIYDSSNKFNQNVLFYF